MPAGPPFSSSAVIESSNTGLPCLRRKLASLALSCSEMYGPCSRMHRDEAGGRNSMSPRPRSCSAPLASRIVRESVFDDRRNEMRDGRFALIEPRDDVDGGPLRSKDQMDADGTRHLGEPADRLFDLVARHHHEIGELVDHDDDEGQRLRRVRVFGVRAFRQYQPDVAVVLLDVSHAFRGQRLVTLFHLVHGPTQRIRGLLRVDDHRRQQVRDLLVHPELQPLGIDQDHPHIVRGRPVEDAGQHRVDAHGLARAGRPAISRCGIAARSVRYGSPWMVLPSTSVSFDADRW